MNKGFLDYNILNFSYQIIDFLLHFFQLFTLPGPRGERSEPDQDVKKIKYWKW